MKKTIITLTSILIISISLNACFWHKNPLLKASNRDVANFLVTASQYGGKTFGMSAMNGAILYGSCMTNDPALNTLTTQSPAVFCQKLYKEMVKYAKTTRNYKNITVSDFTDPKLWRKIQSAYSARTFSAI